MSILWFSNETPDRHGQGGQRRQYFQIESLINDGVDLTVASLSGPQNDASIRAIANTQRLDIWIKGQPLRPRGLAQTALLTRSRPWAGIVVAHAESWRIGQRIARLAKSPAFVDLHNVHSAWHANAGNTPEFQEFFSLEARILRQAERVAVCSEREASKLPQVYSEKVVVMRHGIDPIEWQLEARVDFRPVIKLFGNWDWAPNREGLLWFLEDVWPFVHYLHPSITCDIAGTCRWLVDSPAGVNMVGRVNSVNEFVSDAAAVAVPVQGGVGAPVKYAEALASGVPVIATPEAAHGLPYVGGLVTGDAEVWRRWMADVLDNPTPVRTAARVVRQEVLQRFTWSEQSGPLREWVSEVQGRR